MLILLHRKMVRVRVVCQKKELRRKRTKPVDPTSTCDALKHSVYTLQLEDLLGQAQGSAPSPSLQRVLWHHFPTSRSSLTKEPAVHPGAIQVPEISSPMMSANPVGAMSTPTSQFYSANSHLAQKYNIHYWSSPIENKFMPQLRSLGEAKNAEQSPILWSCGHSAREFGLDEFLWNLPGTLDVNPGTVLIVWDFLVPISMCLIKLFVNVVVFWCFNSHLCEGSVY